MKHTLGNLKQQKLDSKAWVHFPSKCIMVCKPEPIVSEVSSKIALGKGGALQTRMIPGGKRGKDIIFHGENPTGTQNPISAQGTWTHRKQTQEADFTVMPVN